MRFPTTSSLGIGAAFSVLSLATLAMIVSPGGIGSFSIAVQQVLLIYNVDNISFGWLMWGVTTGIIILVGINMFWIINLYKIKIRMKKSNTIRERIFNHEEILQQVKRWRLKSKTIAFTNGVFDIFTKAI